MLKKLYGFEGNFQGNYVKNVNLKYLEGILPHFREGYLRAFVLKYKSID